MASEDELSPVVDDDTVLLDSNGRETTEEITPAGEWPVADLYYVTPDDANPPREPVATVEPTVVATSPGPPATRRRFPPDAGVGAALAILGVLAAIVVGAVLLGREGDDPSAAPRTTTEQSPSSAPVETTPLTPAPAKVEVVGVEGMALPEARTALAGRDLRVRVTRAPSERPRGQVVSQAPSAESSVPTGTVVALVVSDGRGSPPAPAEVEVPGVVGLTSSEAVSALRDAGLKARVRQVTSPEGRGTVVDQAPTAGTTVVEGGIVALEVAKPPKRPPVERVAVPDVVGSAAATARADLRAAGFAVATMTVVSDQPAGTVLEQAPRAGSEVRKGAKVTLTVSAGPADVDVPNVTGLDEASARLELERAGFQVRVIDESIADPAQDGVVLRQAPAAGSSAEDGVVVTITVGRAD